MTEIDIPQDNPILSEQVQAEIPISRQPPASPKRKDKKIILLISLVAVFFLLLFVSVIASAIAQSRLSKQPTNTEKTIPTPTPAPIINQVQIPEIWATRLLPIKKELDALESSQGANDFLPPVFDTQIGL